MVSNIANATLSNMSSLVNDVLVYSQNTDGSTGQAEYTWQNTKWAQQFGYFNSIPELKSALIMKSIWVTGKGYTCDAETQVTLDHITGFGKDTFKDILFNQYLIARLAGDSFAEIIRDEKTGLLLNLKPLDPGSIKVVVDEKGILIRYEQTNKISGNPRRFKPNQIFHLTHNRLADQVHGVSDLVSMEKTILAEYENFDDVKKVMHRLARPMVIFKLGTDDQTKINAFAAKMDAAVNLGENIYIPADENTISYEIVQVNVSAVMMAWREDLKNKFYRTLGLPLTIFGSSGSTESGGKIEYLAHEQVFSHDQKYLEEQIWHQLYLRIKLYSPVTLLENLQTDENKDGNQGLEFQPQDATPGVGQ